MNLKKIKNMSIYSGSVYGTQFIVGLVSILIKNILGPTLTGKFTFLKMIYNYMNYGHFGIRFSIDKNLPRIYNEKNEKAISEFKIKSISAVFVVEVLILLMVLFYIFIFDNNLSDKYLISIILFAAVIHAINSLYKVIYRAEQKTIEISKYTFFYGVTFSLFKLISVLFFSLKGLVVSFLVFNLFFLIVYFYYWKKEKIIIKINYKFIISRIKDGFPLFANGIIIFTLLNVDKWFILGYFNNKELGYYSVATMFFSMFMILPNTFSEILFPDILIDINKKELKTVLSKLLEDIKILSTIFYVLISIFIFIIPFFISFFMPQYKNSIIVTQLIIVGVFSFSITSLSSYFLLGYNKNKTIVGIALISLFLAISLNLIFINFIELNIFYIALASCITYIIYGFMYLFVISVGNTNTNIIFNIFSIILNLIKLISVLIINILANKLVYTTFLLLFIVDIFIIANKYRKQFFDF